MAETSFGKPYREFQLMNGDRLREFTENTSSEEFVWHRDKESRIVYVEECGADWLYQEDNKKPVLLNKGDKIQIEKMVYHRLIRGSDKLIVRIKNL